MLSKVLSLVGWPVLLVIAILIAAAQLLSGMRLVHKVLWAAAAAVAVIGAFNEWKRK
jgi:hypothetical protein